MDLDVTVIGQKNETIRPHNPITITGIATKLNGYTFFGGGDEKKNKAYIMLFCLKLTIWPSSDVLPE